MILEPTVFVLGAGASHQHGFPYGRGLVNKILADLKGADRERIIAAFAVVGVEEATVDRFRDDLQASERDSVDAFIEGRKEDYDLVGRLAISQHLLRREDETKFADDRDWCSRLFNAIL